MRVRQWPQRDIVAPEMNVNYGVTRAKRRHRVAQERARVYTMLDEGARVIGRIYGVTCVSRGIGV